MRGPRAWSALPAGSTSAETWRMPRRAATIRAVLQLSPAGLRGPGVTHSRVTDPRRRRGGARAPRRRACEQVHRDAARMQGGHHSGGLRAHGVGHRERGHQARPGGQQDARRAAALRVAHKVGRLPARPCAPALGLTPDPPWSAGRPALALQCADAPGCALGRGCACGRAASSVLDAHAPSAMGAR